MVLKRSSIWSLDIHTWIILISEIGFFLTTAKSITEWQIYNYCCNYWTQCTSRTILYKSHALALDICKHLKCNFSEFISWTLFLVQLLHTVSIHNSKGRKNTLSAANVLPFLTNTEQYCIFLLNTIMLIAQG